MKIFVVATRTGKPDDVAPHLAAEAKKALQFVADDFFREIYSRADGNGAIVVIEADSVEAAKQRTAELPLVAAGLLDLEFYPVGPYRGIVALAEG